MKGDFTRFTFDPEKGYTGVYMQQGRLQLDADWNEQVAIQQYLLQTYAKNFIGDSGSGAPQAPNDENFTINFTIRDPNEEEKEELKLFEPTRNFMISKGDIYANGILCQLKKDIAYTHQPDYPQTKALEDLKNLKNGNYFAYLDVWERHITALEDPDLFEVALNGLDTATRRKTIWQVKLIKEDEWSKLSESNNAFSHEDYKELITANVTKRIPENRLYRLEIHQGGIPEEALFKWSRSNGSIAFAVKKIENNRITIDSRNLDISQFLSSGQWIEVINESREQKNEEGTLVQLIDVIPVSSEGSQVIIAANPNIESAINSEKFPLTDEGKPSEKIKIRLWNHDPNRTDQPLYSTSGEITLEDGIEVKFSDQPENFQYEIGDYWLLPVRANQITKEEGEKLDLKRIKHYYLELAKAEFLGDYFKDWNDKRPTFPSLNNTLTDKEGLNDLETLSIGTSNKSAKTSAKLVVNSNKIDSKDTGEKLQIKKYDKKNDEDNTVDADKILIATNFDPATELVEGMTIFVGNETRIITEINPATYGHKDGNAAAFKVDSPFDSPLESPTDSSYQLPLTRFFSDDNHDDDDKQVIIRPQGKIKANGLQLDQEGVAITAFSNSFTLNEDLTANETVPTIAAINTELEKKANIDDVNNQLATKANVDDVNDQLAAKANVDDVNNQLATKANVDDVNNQLATKANVDDVNNQLAAKANVDDVNNQLATKANVDDVNDQLAAKANVDDVNDQLAAKANSGGDSDQSFECKDLRVNGNLIAITDGQPKPDEKLPRLQVQGLTKQEISNDQLTWKNNGNIISSKNDIFHLGDTIIETSIDDDDNVSSVTRLITKKEVNTQEAVNTQEETTETDYDYTVSPPFEGNSLPPQTTIAYQPPTAIFKDDQGEEQLTLTAKGTVIIGSFNIESGDAAITPTAKLYVNGKVFAEEVKSRRVETANIHQISSIELKENIRDLSTEEAEQLLQGLKPVKYSYKSDQESKLRAGFISEQVPDLVASSDKSAISPVDIVAILTKAVQDQQETAISLINLIGQQQRDIERLKEQVQALEKKSKRNSFPFR